MVEGVQQGPVLVETFFNARGLAQREERTVGWQHTIIFPENDV